MMGMERMGTEGRSLGRWTREVRRYDSGANNLHRGNGTCHYKLLKKKKTPQA